MEAEDGPSTSGREAAGGATAAAGSKKRKAPRDDAYLSAITDRKLRGRLKHTERLYAAAQKSTAKIGEWLAPHEAGVLEAEGARAVSRPFFFAVPPPRFMPFGTHPLADKRACSQSVVVVFRKRSQGRAPPSPAPKAL